MIRTTGIILNNLSTRKPISKIPQAHKGKISGLCFSPDGQRLLSCGVDRNIKLWGVGGDTSSTEVVSLSQMTFPKFHNSVTTIPTRIL